MSVAEFSGLEFRRALEGLRNGVPNRHAVRVLGCHQEAVEQRFRSQLVACRELLRAERQAEGTLIAGGFGTGKSHLLEYLQHLAVSENFVCSRVVISKETPLYDPGKVFNAAVENAFVPGRRGPAVNEIAVSMQTNSPSYNEFYRWANDPTSPISEIFPATLLLYERLKNDLGLVGEIMDFWSGERLSVGHVRQGLGQCGAAGAFTVRAVPIRQLAVERFAFLSRMIIGAGYAGWVLLIDEVELVGRYSVLQRGRSYAELARWMGRLEEGGYPGLTAVAAITDDFDISVLKEKGDSEHIGGRFRDRGTEEMALQAARAETGMRIIEREAVHVTPPDEEGLTLTYELLRQIHGSAYGWSPPDVEGGRVATRRAMRSYLRRWINEWDLLRLYPRVELYTEEEDVRPTYGQDDTLEGDAEQETSLEE